MKKINLISVFRYRRCPIHTTTKCNTNVQKASNSPKFESFKVTWNFKLSLKYDVGIIFVAAY